MKAVATFILLSISGTKQSPYENIYEYELIIPYELLYANHEYGNVICICFMTIFEQVVAVYAADLSELIIN